MNCNDIQYIGCQEALGIYNRMIENSGGGLVGIRDKEGIEATLYFVQNDLYYPDFSDKLTYLVFRFCSGHFFNDGNKRIALTLGAYFLHKNGKNWYACIFMKQFEAIVYHIAASHIDQELLLRMIQFFINGQDYDEELKIDIAKAMNNGSLGIQGEDYDK